MTSQVGSRATMSLASIPDRILVERSLDQDEAAFAELARRHSSLMRAYVSRIVGSLSEADDVVQEALIIAWRQLPSLRDHAAAKAWLMRIASREAYSRIRRRTAEIPIDLVEPPDQRAADPEGTAVRSAQLAALSSVLDSLPPDQKQVWLLREVAELSYGEIATEMNIPATTVRGTLSRARASIAIRMEAWR